MIPANLAPAARSAYRDVLRAARTTFQGDPTRHIALVTALRATFESPTLTAPSSSVAHSAPKPKRRSLLRKEKAEGVPEVDPASPEELAKRIQEWKDVAEFLRRNVVQGRLNEETGTYKLRVTKDTELGDNEEIRTPKPQPITPFPNRKKCGE